MKLAAIVVIYNRKIKDSPSCMQLMRFQEIKIIVIDNSNKEYFSQSNADYCYKNSLDYLGLQHNTGLSKAYNIGIRFVTENYKLINWITIFDHDTHIPENYYNAVKKNVEYWNPFLPIIGFPIVKAKDATNNIQISPKLVFPAIADKLFINSGIVLSQKIFLNNVYNENLFIDLVDYDFILSLRKKYSSDLIEIPISSTLMQEFSGTNFTDKLKDRERFLLFINDSKRFCRKWKSLKFYSYLKIFKRALHLSLHYKTIQFIIDLLKTES